MRAIASRATPSPRWRTAFAVGLGAISLASCGGQGARSNEELGHQEEKVILGSESSPDDNAVVFMLVSLGASFRVCSGVLVAPNLMATARHCVAETDEDKQRDYTCSWSPVTGQPLGLTFYTNVNPQAIQVFGAGTNKGLPNWWTGRVSNPDAIGTKIFASAATSSCGNDMALVLLDRAIPNIPALQLRLANPTLAGEPVRVVGWGNVDATCTRSYVRQTHTTSVLMAGPGLYRDSEDERPLYVIQNEILTGPGPCYGDSGGAIFSSAGALVAIISNGEVVNPTVVDTPIAPCTRCLTNLARNISVREQADLFARAFHEAGASMWYESRPRPQDLGTACEQDFDCVSQVCAGTPGNLTCSSACDTAPCPASLECRESHGVDGGPTRRVCQAPVVPPPAAPDCAVQPRSTHNTTVLQAFALVCALLLLRRTKSERQAKSN